jgi:demethylmenaquinone methyltransferase/2-methoxy-6-polyprenyl-1,4-benzoquinol methylase
LRVLDVACGTGDIAFEAAAEGARVVGLDVTERMLQIARSKGVRSGLRARFVRGDMMALPFPSASFDVVTTGYGLRNVPELGAAIEEIARVLVPGGQLLSLDFDRPANPLKRGVYLAYLAAVGSALGVALHGDPDTYRYIPESIKRYPGAQAVCTLLRARGFSSCSHEPVFAGFMAIHRARK